MIDIFQFFTQYSAVFKATLLHEYCLLYISVLTFCKFKKILHSVQVIAGASWVVTVSQVVHQGSSSAISSEQSVGAFPVSPL